MLKRHPAPPVHAPAFLERLDRQEPGSVTPPVPRPTGPYLDVQFPSSANAAVACGIAVREERFRFEMPRPQLLDGGCLACLDVQALGRGGGQIGQPRRTGKNAAGGEPADEAQPKRAAHGKIQDERPCSPFCQALRCVTSISSSEKHSSCWNPRPAVGCVFLTEKLKVQNQRTEK
jgi:hypothetical protein